jgi:heptosyltransferase II
MDQVGAAPHHPVLIVGPSWVGDMVMAQALFITLAKQQLGVEIDVLCPAWSLPLLARMPEVRQAIEIPLKHGELGLAKRYRLGTQLRGNDYKQAIVLTRSLKSALVPFHAGIPVRTGYRGEFRYGLINDMRPTPEKAAPTASAFVALACDPGEESGIEMPSPRLRVDIENQQALLSRLKLNSDRRVVAMMPGAEYGPAKCWPLAYFGELAAGIVARGDAVWILGSEKDGPAGEQIASHAGAAVRNLCGQTRLEDVVDLLALAGAAVSNDSGLMHVAAAVGIPVLALFGSSSPAKTPPLSEKARVMYLDLECSPCFSRVCPLEHFNCLRKITPAMADAVLTSMLNP